MEIIERKHEFQQALVSWFKREKRDLPWRQTKDPYKIWVSEVMLQQTRVDTVIPYYKNFLTQFPTMNDLANAPEEILLKEWEGLGYYSRARNLQTGVREVVEKYNGIVPDNRQDILTLKGVGPYTAGAVLSIAYGKPEHAVDGNVMRVLSRILLIHEDIAQPKTRKVFEQAVTELIDHDDPSSFNQGLMELGAMICTPTSPKCLLCPVRNFCRAYHEGMENTLPIKSKKKSTTEVNFTMIAIQNELGQWLMEKRPQTGLLASMWQFPMIENANQNIENLFREHYNIELKKVNELFAFKHVFSHLTWNISSYVALSKGKHTLKEGCQWFSEDEVQKLPMPVPVLKIWKKLNNT